MAFRPPEAFNIAHYFLDARLEEGKGERRALVTDQGEFTYREVRDLANRFANVLREEGVQPEQRVIVSMADGLTYVAALFGILKVGGVVVMVNPGLDPDQIRYFLGYTRARAAVVDDATAPAFREAGSDLAFPHRLLAADGEEVEDRLAGASTEFDSFSTHRDDPAVWLFSGGTTGRPKAVVQTHTSYANSTECYGKGVLGIGPDDLTISVPKLYFGYALGSNLFFPFSVGGAAVLFGERTTVDALFDRVRRHRPTILVNVPTMVGRMVDHPRAEEVDLSCLRLATSAGEALPVELHKRWDETFGVELLDGLGTAEMWHIFLSNRPGEVKRGTLGRPVPGFEVKLCDEEEVTVRDGEVGRLWVRGNSRAIGYWQRMEETKAAFRGEWYVSGDMLRRDEEGRYVYCGRSDDMLKVSGKWLSPQEVENCLLEHPAVREVAVVGVTNQDGLTKPHAYVVSEDPHPDLPDELRNFVAERLEPYKAPREVHLLDDLPRTHLGKVDRGELSGKGG